MIEYRGLLKVVSKIIRLKNGHAFFCMFLIIALSEGVSNADEKNGKIIIAPETEKKIIETRENKPPEIDNLIPSETGKVSMIKVLTLDFFVPGGGHFYRGDYYFGIAFLLFKFAGAYSIYYFYKEWKYARSLYLSAKKSNELIDPDHELYFADPDGGYKTVEGFKQKYDSTVQLITLTVLANIVIYTASIIINYNYINEMNEKSYPTFELQYSRVSYVIDEDMLVFQCTFKI